MRPSAESFFFFFFRPFGKPIPQVLEPGLDSIQLFVFLQTALLIVVEALQIK